jgi:hypothetical protein
MNRTLYRAEKVDDPDHSEKWAVTYHGKVVNRYATRRQARIAAKQCNAKLQDDPARPRA